MRSAQLSAGKVLLLYYFHYSLQDCWGWPHTGPGSWAVGGGWAAEIQPWALPLHSPPQTCSLPENQWLKMTVAWWPHLQQNQTELHTGVLQFSATVFTQSSHKPFSFLTSVKAAMLGGFSRHLGAGGTCLWQLSVGCRWVRDGADIVMGFFRESVDSTSCSKKMYLTASSRAKARQITCSMSIVIILQMERGEIINMWMCTVTDAEWKFRRLLKHFYLHVCIIYIYMVYF